MVTSKPSITNCPFTFFQICTGWVYTFSGLLIQKLETGNRNIVVMNLRFYFSSCHNLIQVVIARGFHLFPFRTEKLSLVTPMVLRNSGRVGSRRFKEVSLVYWRARLSVFYYFGIYTALFRAQSETLGDCVKILIFASWKHPLPKRLILLLL